MSGIGVSLRIVFAVVLGGMYSLLGSSVGTALTIALSEFLRIYFGIKLIGIAETIYGLVLILCIIFLPVGHLRLHPRGPPPAIIPNGARLTSVPRRPFATRAGRA